MKKEFISIFFPLKKRVAVFGQYVRPKAKFLGETNPRSKGRRGQEINFLKIQ